MPWPALAYPLRVIAGVPVTVESDSIEHLETQGEIAIRTPRGALEAQPETGLRDLIGMMGDVGPEIIETLSDAVPQAIFLAEEDTTRLAEHVRNVRVSLGSA